MITLYHCADARSFRVVWALEELSLPYDLRMLPFPPRALARDYLAVNPLGTVPLLIEGDVRMTESAAICQYLAARHSPVSLGVQPGEPSWAAYLNWVHFGEATLTFPLAIVLRYKRLESQERRLPQAVSDYERWFLGRLRAVDAALAGSDTLCAGRFTAADISVGYALHLADIVGLSNSFAPDTARYLDRLRARGGFRRSVEAQERAGHAQGVPATSLRG